MEKVVIVWFRNDLRLHDNEVIYRAWQTGLPVIPLFCLSENLSQNDLLGFPKVGSFRRQFMKESLQDLKENLKKKGSDLLIKIGNLPNVFTELCQNFVVEQIFFQKSVTTEEQIEENLLRNSLSAKVSFNGIYNQTLLAPENIDFVPNIFTDFKQSIAKKQKIPDLFPLPEKISLPVNFRNDYYNLPWNEENSTSFFQGGESNALKRLHYYFWETDLIQNYKETRNGLLGTDYSSRFSPWLSLGCISPRKIYHELRNYEKERGENQSTYWLFFELLWRDFFWLMAKKYGNKIFLTGGIKDLKIKFPVKKQMEENFTLWCSGKTGVPFIDANMRELISTGFMSNRGRQNVASFLINELNVNWTWGARFFESLLIDYDPASNWGNWSYLAGTGNDPRGKRHFNILRQTKNYDPHCLYIKSQLPELFELTEKQIFALFPD